MLLKHSLWSLILEPSGSPQYYLGLEVEEEEEPTAELVFSVVRLLSF
jgi:hypothetical protein